MDEDGTPFGAWGDHCPFCGTDWKRPHFPECSAYHRCEYPPGCEDAAARGRRLCPPHLAAVSALFAPAVSP